MPRCQTIATKIPNILLIGYKISANSTSTNYRLSKQDNLILIFFFNSLLLSIHPQMRQRRSSEHGGFLSTFYLDGHGGLFKAGLFCTTKIMPLSLVSSAALKDDIFTRGDSAV